MLDDNKDEMNKHIEYFQPDENIDNGEEIILMDEICFSWGFTYKKKTVSLLGEDLSKKGYRVKIIHWADRLKIKVYKMYLIKDNKEILLFSDKEKDRTEDVIIADNCSKVKNELIEKILNLHSIEQSLILNNYFNLVKK